jgi:hypothetical protein
MDASEKVGKANRIVASRPKKRGMTVSSGNPNNKSETTGFLFFFKDIDGKGHLFLDLS